MHSECTFYALDYERKTNVTGKANYFRVRRSARICSQPFFCIPHKSVPNVIGKNILSQDHFCFSNSLERGTLKIERLFDGFLWSLKNHDKIVTVESAIRRKVMNFSPTLGKSHFKHPIWEMAIEVTQMKLEFSPCTMSVHRDCWAHRGGVESNTIVCVNNLGNNKWTATSSTEISCLDNWRGVFAAETGRNVPDEMLSLFVIGKYPNHTSSGFPYISVCVVTIMILEMPEWFLHCGVIGWWNMKFCLFRGVASR